MDIHTHMRMCTEHLSLPLPWGRESLAPSWNPVWRKSSCFSGREGRSVQS